MFNQDRRALVLYLTTPDELKFEHWFEVCAKTESDISQDCLQLKIEYFLHQKEH